MQGMGLCWPMSPKPITYVMFLRGINVGGHRKVPMADLRALIARVTGDAAARTYIASGNAVFVSADERAELTARLGQAIEQQFGFTVPVMLISMAELQEVLAGCPWPDVPGNQVHAFFCFSRPSVDSARIKSLATQGEAVEVKGNTVWMHTPGGLGKSQLAARIDFGAESTARNLNTLRACANMAKP